MKAISPNKMLRPNFLDEQGCVVTFPKALGRIYIKIDHLQKDPQQRLGLEGFFMFVSKL